MSVLRSMARNLGAARGRVGALVCAGAVLLAVNYAAPALVAATQDEEKVPAKDPDAKAPPKEDDPAPKGAPAAGAEDFDTVYGELKVLINDLNALRVKFGAAKEADRPAIEAEYNEKVERGQALFPKMTPAAEKAFAAKPDMTSDAAKHLSDTMQRAMAEGNTKEADRLLKFMIAKVPDNAELLSLAGSIAFNAGDNKAAAESLKKAAQAGKLDDNAQKILDELKVREVEAKADDLPRVKLQTSKGDIVIELFENEAPNTVANYVNLIEKKFYNGLTFHRVIDGFVAQGGDPAGNGTGGPGYAVPCECDAKAFPKHRNHFRGTLSMAHAGKDTGGSQFFLCLSQTTHLDGKHTAFGRIIEGMEVLDKLQRTEGPAAGAPDKIVKATVVRKREHEYKPKTLPDPKG